MISDKGRSIMPRRKRKKVTRNINLESQQESYLQKRFGKEASFSEIIRKSLKLVISMLEGKIITDLSDEKIEKFTESYNEEMIRAASRSDRVMEYKDLFELLTYNARYLMPDIESFPIVLLNILDFFADLAFTKMTKTSRDRLYKIARNTNIIEDIDLIYDEVKKVGSTEYMGSYPYSLIWYVKIVTILLSHSKSKWGLVKTVPEHVEKLGDLRRIRFHLERNVPREEALKRLNNYFNNIRIKLLDQNNSGIWDILNNRYYAIVDQECLKYFQGVEAQEIPFRDSIDEINQLPVDGVERGLLVVRLYEKRHLISNVVYKENEVVLLPRDPCVVFMLNDTCDYLNLSYEMRNLKPNLSLTIH